MINDLWQRLRDDCKPIYLYGMGNGAEKILDTLDAFDLKASGVFVSDGFVRDKSFRGFKLKSYADVCKECDDFTVLVAFGTSLDDVISNIRRIAGEHTLLVPDVAVFGDGLFTLDTARKERRRIENIYDRLADECSRHTFECIIKYKITGEPQYLFDCESALGTAYTDILRLSDTECFVDLGAYRGDTVSEFLRYSGGEITAVEPDKKTFAKLVKAVGDGVKCINAAASDKSGVGFFDMQSGRGSHLASGGTPTPTIAVDDIETDSPITYIKMDVEGAEAAAIDGAEKTIAVHKPRLNIAAYHRSLDILDIPERVLGINPDYKLYLRHFKYLPAWDTNYYFV